jgi:hypothetical protein
MQPIHNSSWKSGQHHCHVSAGNRYGMARAPAAPSLSAQRFQLLLQQLLDETGGKHGDRSAVGRRLGLSQAHVSMLVDGKRWASSRTVEKAQRMLHLRPEFFAAPDSGRPPHYREFLTGQRIAESAVPESFKLWRANSAPSGLTPEIERHMLSTGFEFAPSEAHRWSTVYDLVIADIHARTGGARRRMEVVEPPSRVRRRTR